MTITEIYSKAVCELDREGHKEVINSGLETVLAGYGNLAGALKNVADLRMAVGIDNNLDLAGNHFVIVNHRFAKFI